MNQVEQLAQLLVPFEADDIKLRAQAVHAQSPLEWCDLCHSHHGLPATHLQYVGHAALTRRLLAVDPLWDWQPLARQADGTPQFDGHGGLWIELTVCQMTRLGYGHADGKTGGNAIKEAIGDALRNAAMRFGAALNLWHRAELPPPNTPISLSDTPMVSHHTDQSKSEPTGLTDKPDYPAAQFERYLPDWRELVSRGQSIDSIRCKLNTKYTLNADQLKQLNALESPTAHAHP